MARPAPQQAPTRHRKASDFSRTTLEVATIRPEVARTRPEMGRRRIWDIRDLQPPTEF